jgi:hypothetical protein
LSNGGRGGDRSGSGQPNRASVAAAATGRHHQAPIGADIGCASAVMARYLSLSSAFNS